MVPIGIVRAVMPLDILPTFLLRALLMGDHDRAESLGCAGAGRGRPRACAPSSARARTTTGWLLRQRNLTRIEKEAG
jgi:Na+-transporting NADH:ubiquinone oxidoreductase subunit A